MMIDRNRIRRRKFAVCVDGGKREKVDKVRECMEINKISI